MTLDIPKGFGPRRDNANGPNVGLSIIERVSIQRSCWTDITKFPGYTASHVQISDTTISADLVLAGKCNVYGSDLQNLRITIDYQTDTRVHVKIYDPEEQVYQVPDYVLPSPNGTINATDSTPKVVMVESPFSFAHIDPLILNITNYTRTLWARDADGFPPGTNLYGNHPVYFENCPATQKRDGQYLENNTVGGTVDLYFMAGPGPIDVAKQYSELSDKAAMMPYWGFGFHNCRLGYASVSEIIEAVINYSAANIPLGTMWTDIVPMNDPTSFPLPEMRELVTYLHEHGQHYVVIVDLAVAYQNYNAFNDGAALDHHIDIGALWIDRSEPSNLYLINPQYTINNAGGSPSNHTVLTNLIHANGLAEYDTHSLYGAMMSATSQHPTIRPLIVTRSILIRARTQSPTSYNFASIFQVPMVGADICGFIDNTTETLCARRATLGTFYTFSGITMRRHRIYCRGFLGGHCFAEAARNAINTRYKLLDYICTGFYKQTVNGTPVLSPPMCLFRSLPRANSPHSRIFTSIPVYILGGSIPMRVSGADTTTTLPKLDFEILAVPDANGIASGELYLER
ncbi:hypothetical protein BDZ45DRAFT_714590 [Acephala macrosclerotiorum]|nr:hypothetical protein BDZ45DRAFT_714590 [Acephala macrosclerotiorum]